MKFQKILALVTLIVAALSIVLSLAFSSGIMYAVTQPSVRNPGGTDAFHAAALYKFGGKANDILIVMSIILLVSVVLLYFMQCVKRRNYYISNYIAIGVFAVYALAFVITVFVIIGKCFALIGDIDFAAWKAREEIKTETGAFRYAQLYTKNVSTLVLFIILAIVVIALIAAWVLNVVWKIKLMKGEKELLEKSGTPKTAEMEVA